MCEKCVRGETLLAEQKAGTRDLNKEALVFRQQVEDFLNGVLSPAAEIADYGGIVIFTKMAQTALLQRMIQMGIGPGAMSVLINGAMKLAMEKEQVEVVPLPAKTTPHSTPSWSSPIPMGKELHD